MSMLLTICPPFPILWWVQETENANLLLENKVDVQQQDGIRLPVATLACQVDCADEGSRAQLITAWHPSL